MHRKDSDEKKMFLHKQAQNGWIRLKSWHGNPVILKNILFLTLKSVIIGCMLLLEYTYLVTAYISFRHSGGHLGGIGGSSTIRLIKAVRDVPLNNDLNEFIVHLFIKWGYLSEFHSTDETKQSCRETLFPGNSATDSHTLALWLHG